MIIKIFFSTSILFASITSFGQDLRAIESDLSIHLNKIGYWSEYSSSNDYSEKVNWVDSLAKENNIFEEKLRFYTTNQPLTLICDFDSLKFLGLNIITSKDKRFRIYTWDTETGGTMHFYKNIYQYKSNDEVFSKVIQAKDSATDQPDPGLFYRGIYSVMLDKKNIYLATGSSVLGSGYYYESIGGFTIDNEILNDTIGIIKIGPKLRNQMGYEVDLTSSANKGLDRNIKLAISFDEKEKTFSFPEKLKGGKITDQVITFKFNGLYFERLNSVRVSVH